MPQLSPKTLAAILGAALLATGLAPVHAQDSASAAPDSPIKDLGNGIYEIGQVRLDQNQRTIIFPGAVNMDRGALEYLLVTKIGPTHESLLLSNITPSDLHLAMVLLGAKGAGIRTPAPGDAPPAQITSEYLKKAPPIAGDRISIAVEWQDRAGAKKKAPVEDWLFLSSTHKPAPRGPWTYSGSMFSQSGHFMAQEEGIFAALVINPSALINNPRKGNDDDQIWEVNEKAVPPAETPVQISIHLETPTP